MNQESIGKFIASLRKEKGLTQEQLASSLGVSDKTISNWEKYGVDVNYHMTGWYIDGDGYLKQSLLYDQFRCSCSSII